MKTIHIKNVPCGANLLIANDVGNVQILKEDTILLEKYYGDGTFAISYEDHEEKIIRIRCANAEGGYWNPVEVKTKDMLPDEEKIVEMKEDRLLSKHLKKK